MTMSEGNIPRHIAIIMDGNGRWATMRGKSRVDGHKAGAETSQKIIRAAKELKIPYITLFGFSSENWNRPQDEVYELMGLLRYYLKRETAELHKSGVRLKVIGQRDRLDKDIVKMIENAEDLTKNNEEITVIIALSYGGQQDIVQAAKQLAEKAISGEIETNDIDEDVFSSCLLTKGIPDPDLVIRTSGEKRISNFLLWQSAYAEFYFTDVLWPDFDKTGLEEAINVFATRERRFGALPIDKNISGNNS